VPSLRQGWDIQVRVIGALMLRELTTRFGRENIGFLWIMVEPMGLWLMGAITAGMPDGSWLKTHLQDGAAHMRLVTMGIILLLVLRFSPRGLIPEK
jgi:ABC-type polysaccharide/polyol phosphate export permease